MMEFTFEESPWEGLLGDLEDGSSICCTRLLALTQEEEDLEQVFQTLEARRIALDISRLPPNTVSGETGLRLRREEQLARKGTLLTELEEPDPLRLYLEELARIPVAGDEQVLAMAYLEGDQRAAQRLADLSLHRVVALATETTGRGVLLLDLIQEANLGLWQGILQYTGDDFAVHRDWWIRQYLARAVVLQARSGELGQKLRQGMEDYRDVDQRLLTELGRNPTPEELAEAMHTDVETVEVYSEMTATARAVAQTHRPEAETEEDGDQAVENTAYFQSRQRIEALLSALEPRDARLLSLRFGLEGGAPLNPAQTGKLLGMTPEEVVEREAAALASLRKDTKE